MTKKFLGNLSLVFIIPAFLLTFASCGQTGRNYGITHPPTVHHVMPQPADAEEVKPEAGVTLGAPDRSAAERRADDQAALLAKAMRDRNMFINEDVYFALDDSSLDEIARTVLREKAKWILSNKRTKVTIEGHCDERGTSEYNLTLGDRRAESAKAFLVDMNISPDRITTISYGEENPIDPRKHEEAWARNRRAHFVLE